MSEEPTSANPAWHPCRCGCGNPSIREFLPGHDQRAIHARIAKIGTVAQFLDWFDEHYED